MDLRIKLLLGCLFTLAVLTCHLSCQEHDDNTLTRQSPNSTTERPATVASNGMASRLKAAFFKLIDFKSFKAKFNKHYGSPTEEVARHKLFSVRYLKAKLSMMAYHMGLSTSHTGINRMSDSTQTERDRLKNKLDFRGLPRHTSDRPGGVDTTAHRTAPVAPMSEAEAQRIGAIKDASLLDRGLGSITRALKRVTGSGGGSKSKDYKSSKSAGSGVSYGRKGGVHVDLRKSTDCLNKPRYQGSCGSCYAFAAIAQYEFMYCLAHGKRIKFSEQFIVDCGPEHLQMGGCEGGTPDQVAQFAHVLGLQKQSAYPYTESQGECRLSSASDQDSAVFAKTETANTLVAANLDEFEYWLKRKVPLYVSFGMDDSSFYDYANGIDNPTTCDTTGHAMLVVGMGSDDKHGDYFILRNSMGTDWGRSGYYYVYKQSPCWRFGGSGWAPEGLKQMGKNAFSGVKAKQVDHHEDDAERDHVQPPPVVHVPKHAPKPEARKQQEDKEEDKFMHNDFDSDDEDDNDDDDDDDVAGKKGQAEDQDQDDHEEVSQVRTWTPAPPPKFEWKPNDNTPTRSPYEGLHSNFEYNFDADNDLHYTGGGQNGGYNQQENYNSYNNYDSYFNHYDYGAHQN